MLCVENGQYLRTRNLAEVKTGFHDMLNLLGVDYIDVGLIHYCDSLSDWQNILDKGGLDYAETLKNAGKIGHIGLSSHNPVVARKAVETGKSKSSCSASIPATTCSQLMKTSKNLGCRSL